MAKTFDEYQALLKEKNKSVEEAKEQYQAAEKTLAEASGLFSDAQSKQRSGEFALHSHKLDRTWLVMMGIALAFDVVIPFYGLYWLKAEDNFWQALGHNGVPAILGVLSVVLWILGVIFLFNKNKKSKKLEADKAVFDSEVQKAQAVVVEKDEARNAALTYLEKCQTEHQKILDAFYKDFPEELQKVNAQKQQAQDAARKEYEERVESERLAAENALQKQKDLIEAQKMFEHPQAYIMDGQFENDFQVFTKAAEMGCEDAQVRVVETYLGISYKSGVKVDVAKGEALALHFAEGRSFIFYEILGKAFLYGEGNVQKNEEKGLKYLEKAASKGRQKAMMMAAVCHYNGVGTEKNEARARDYFARAAKQGNPQAIQVIVAMDNGEKLRF